MPSASAATGQTSFPPHNEPGRPPLSQPNELLLQAESQWLFTEPELLLAPSILHGLSPTKERENRAKGVNFILQVGIMLKLPQITLATASVFLHRFFMRYSMIDDKASGRTGMHYYSIAATSLFLATKVEENCRKMKELVVACVRVAQKNPAKIVDEQDKEYWKWKDTILQFEDLLLEALCFDLSLEPPYKTLFDFLEYFGEAENKRLRNTAWAFVNDSYLTMLCLLFSSRTIAASALYAAARHCGVRFPDDERGRPWWEVVGIELNAIKKACNYMASVYVDTPLRAGSEGSIYEKTPEEGDELLAKTRERRDTNEGDGSSQVMGRSNSHLSNAESNSSRKRTREEEEAVTHEIGSQQSQENGNLSTSNGESREVKRQRTETNGSNGMHNIDNYDGTSGTAQPPTAALEARGVISLAPDDGSEEGEVEA